MDAFFIGMILCAMAVLVVEVMVVSIVSMVDDLKNRRYSCFWESLCSHGS